MPRLRDIPNHSTPKLSHRDLEMIKHVKPGGNWMDIPESIPSQRLHQIREMSALRGIVRTTYYGRLRCDQPAYTIATYFNRPGNGTNIHPWEHRTLTCREAARLQSFPDSFLFLGTEAHIRKQIGNAVPPLLAYAVGKSLGPLKFVDLFAGAGGLSLGLELAGLEAIAGQELLQPFANTYVHNHSQSVDMIVGDIRDSNIQENLVKSIRENLKKKQLDLLTGGPPCQGFSTAGWRSHNDERNALIVYFLRMIEQLTPKYVLIENVEGLLSMMQGQVVRNIQKALVELGYIYDEPWLLNAEEFGVPQMRRRVFIVAAQKGLPMPSAPRPYFDKCLGRRETENNRRTPFLSYPVTVAEALFDLPALTPVVKEYLPEFQSTNPSYSLWCKGLIPMGEFLDERGNASQKSATNQLLLDLD
jgi:DNA (cytosine-5)-methyltransferase 1